MDFARMTAGIRSLSRERLVREAGAIAALLVALFLAGAALGFHIEDEQIIARLPWYDVFSESARAAAGAIGNPFGLFGARLSLLFIRTMLGYPTVLPLIAVVMLAWQFMRIRPLRSPLLFLAYSLMIALDLGTMFGLTTASFGDLMSGATGRMLASFLTTVIGAAGAWALTATFGIALTVLMGRNLFSKAGEKVRRFAEKAEENRIARQQKREEKQRLKDEKRAAREEKKAGKLAAEAAKRAEASALATPSAAPAVAREAELQKPQAPAPEPPDPPKKQGRSIPILSPVQASAAEPAMPAPAPVPEPEEPDPIEDEPPFDLDDHPVATLPDPDAEIGPEMVIVDTVHEKEADLDERSRKVSTKTRIPYILPSIDLLQKPKEDDGDNSYDERHLAESKNRLLDKLSIYKIDVVRIETTVGPRVTLFELELAPDVKISRVKSLADDLAMALAARGIRIIAPIPGKNAVGVEIPNGKPRMVMMRSVLQVEKFKNNRMALPIVLGKTISNEVLVDDLATMPHLLIAGTTGSGKSVAVNVILTSLLYAKNPDQVKFVLIDPKRVELSQYQSLKNHFLPKIMGQDDQIIVTDPLKAVAALRSAVLEMERRYELLEKSGVRNIGEYNQKFRGEPMFYLVVVIDELADLMMTAGREVEGPITRLAQMARAVGIHLIVATQRPSVDVITGIIKANFPSRIAFQVASKIDSRTILDTSGAEQLLGNGDMLFQSVSMPKPIRVQSPYISSAEVEAITSFIGSQQSQEDDYALPKPEPVNGSASGNGGGADRESRDSLFDEAARLIVLHQQASTSLLQRRMRLGFSRAGRLMDQLEHAGIVGAQDGSRPRDVLVKDEDSLELLLRNLD